MEEARGRTSSRNEGLRLWYIVLGSVDGECLAGLTLGNIPSEIERNPRLVLAKPHGETVASLPPQVKRPTNREGRPQCMCHCYNDLR